MPMQTPDFHSEGRTSPHMAAGIVAKENAWKDMEAEFGLLDGRTVAQILGSKPATDTFDDNQRRTRKISGISRLNADLYPGFQFTEFGRIHESVLDVLRVAPKLRVTNEDMAQWFLLESPSLDGHRPVDVIDDAERVLAVFCGRFEARW